MEVNRVSGEETECHREQMADRKAKNQLQGEDIMSEEVRRKTRQPKIKCNTKIRRIKRGRSCTENGWQQKLQNNHQIQTRRKKCTMGRQRRRWIDCLDENLKTSGIYLFTGKQKKIEIDSWRNSWRQRTMKAWQKNCDWKQLKDDNMAEHDMNRWTISPPHNLLQPLLCKFGQQPLYMKIRYMETTVLRLQAIIKVY